MAVDTSMLTHTTAPFLYLSGRRLDARRIIKVRTNGIAITTTVLRRQQRQLAEEEWPEPPMQGGDKLENYDVQGQGDEPFFEGQGQSEPAFVELAEPVAVSISCVDPSTGESCPDAATLVQTAQPLVGPEIDSDAVELVLDVSCPNTGARRRRLLAATVPAPVTVTFKVTPRKASSNTSLEVNSWDQNNPASAAPACIVAPENGTATTTVTNASFKAEVDLKCVASSSSANRKWSGANCVQNSIGGGDSGGVGATASCSCTVTPPPPKKDNGGTSIHLAAMDYTVQTIANIFRKPLVLKKVYVKRDEKRSEKKDRSYEPGLKFSKYDRLHKRRDCCHSITDTAFPLFLIPLPLPSPPPRYVGPTAIIAGILGIWIVGLLYLNIKYKWQWCADITVVDPNEASSKKTVRLGTHVSKVNPRMVNPTLSKEKKGKKSKKPGRSRATSKAESMHDLTRMHLKGEFARPTFCARLLLRHVFLRMIFEVCERERERGGESVCGVVGGWVCVCARVYIRVVVRVFAGISTSTRVLVL